MPLRLVNTLTRRLEPVAPADPAHIRFYSCGPTVYDDAHIGNFRSFLAADVLRRYLESPLCAVTGPTGDPVPGPRRVTHVMNITDVGHMTDDTSADASGEDRMQVAGRRLAEAKKSGALPPGATAVDPSDPCSIAEFYAARFLDDARRLGLKVALEAQADPTLMPRPTRAIPAMIELVRQLIASGHAYAVGPPARQAVYFDVATFPAYGRLSGNTLEQLRAGAGGRVTEATQQQKRNPADFLLWKADPSHLMRWPSPWGEGYPGWHLECSAMARERLGDEVDVHSGGEDNIFPHHECEIAQSCSATGRPVFARHWFHVRHLMVESDKMSKSKGNFFTARDLFQQGFEPGAVRLELIKTHYRSNANFTMQGLRDAQRTLERWRRFGESARRAAERAPDASEALARFAAALDDDLNVAEAIAQVNRWMAETPQPGRDAAAALDTIDAVLGVLALERAESARTDIGLFAPGVPPDDRVLEKLRERAAARAQRNFARSDEIRDELAAMGYAIKDVAGGKVEVSRR